MLVKVLKSSIDQDLAVVFQATKELNLTTDRLSTRNHILKSFLFIPLPPNLEYYLRHQIV